MTRKFLLITFTVPALLLAQVKDFVPVTDQMLLNPSPDDWLMFSRTYDAQRFSPLSQVNKQNVSQLALAWSRGLGPGITETIPTVYKGVMYVNVPGGAVQALDATTGDLIWEYQRRRLPQKAREDGDEVAERAKAQVALSVKRDRRHSRSMTT